MLGDSWRFSATECLDDQDLDHISLFEFLKQETQKSLLLDHSGRIRRKELIKTVLASWMLSMTSCLLKGLANEHAEQLQ